MSRYIDADKAIFELGIEEWEIDCKYFIEEQPTADVVEVVRCKDCIYYKLNLWSTEDKFFCQRWLHWIPTAENDYCSQGKKVE